jgi:hypothetical protein
VDLELDGSACQALRAGRALNLTPAEYRLLRYLLVNAHKVLSKEQIGRCAWGDFGDNAIEQLVSPAPRGRPGRPAADPHPPRLRLLARRCCYRPVRVNSPSGKS